MDSYQPFMADYPPLRMMSSLSHLQQFSKASKRSPNNPLSHRARIMKPASTQNSPSRRRRAAPVPMTRPATFHAQQPPPAQAPGFPEHDANTAHLPYSAVGHRPVTWHPAFSGSWYHPMTAQPQPSYAVNYSNGEMFGGYNHQGVAMPSQQPPYSYTNNVDYTQMSNTLQPAQQWPSQATSWFESSPSEHGDGNDLSLGGLNLNQTHALSGHDTATSFEKSQTGNYPRLADAHAAGHLQQSDQGELVGMGLHDKSTNYEQPSLLLGAGLDEHEKPSPEAPQLTLAVETSPPEQVPDTIPDEGGDTPITNDLQDFSSPFEAPAFTPYEMAAPMHVMNQHNQYNQQQYYDLSGHSFFFDPGQDVNGNQWYPAQGKPLPMNYMPMTQGMWTTPQNR